MKTYVINPCYYLKMDGDRAILCSRDIIRQKIHYEDCFTFIHPLNAQMLTFFNGVDNIDIVRRKIADYMNLPQLYINESINKYIENENGFSIKHKNSWMYFPENLIVNKDNVTNYSVYDIQDFHHEREPDLESIRTSFPLNINFQLTMKCYTDCIYCYADRALPTNNLLSLEQIINIIDQAADIGVLNFDVNGGEVLLHPNYKEIYSKLLQKGYRPLISTKIPISLLTIQSLKKIGITGIQISLDSSNKDVLKKHLGVNDSYIVKMMQTLKHLDQEDFRVQINTVLTSYNSSIEEIDCLVSFLSQYKSVKKINFVSSGYSLYKSPFDFLDYRTSACFVEELILHIDRLKEKFPHILFSSGLGHVKTEYENKNIVSFENRAICTGNVRGMVILPDGRVTICEELYAHPKFIIGDLKTQSILDVWNSQRANELFKLRQSSIGEESICKSCTVFDSCRQRKGVCWKEILMAYGALHWDFPDPRCPKAPKLYNEIWDK